MALLISAGEFITIVFPGGAHDAVISGTHGIGVSTPQAAAVADATVGLLIDWHMPNDIIFVIGIMSVTLAMSMLPHLGLVGTVTISVDGDIPKVHCSIAPAHTKFPICLYI